MDILENKIADYINNYFSPNELKIMKKYYYHSYSHDDTVFSDLEYQQLSAFYKRLAGIAENSKYRVEIDKCGTALLEKIFERYVSKNTFVISTIESHLSVQQCVNSINPNNTYKIYTGKKEHFSNEIYTEAYEAFKKSGCTNVLILLEGVIPGFSWIIDNSVFLKFKHVFDIHNIPSILVLDDCQGIFHVNRDYEIFDAILATTHTLEIGFDMGILFTKLPHKIGYINKTGLKNFKDKLEIIVNHKDKANQFNGLLREYFAPFKNEYFIFPEHVSQQHFTIHLNNIKSIPSKLAIDLCSNYLFIFNETNSTSSWFRIRYHEFIIQDSNKMLEGLKKTKETLKKLIRYQELNKEQSFEFNKDIMEPVSLINEKRFKILNDFYHYTNEDVIIQMQNSIKHRLLQGKSR